MIPLLLLCACASQEEKAARAGNEALQALEAGDLPRAKLAILEAIGHRDDVAAYWLLLGRTSLAMGEAGAAYNAFMRASELDRSNPEALLGVAQMSLAAGRLDDAWKYADQFLLVVPDEPAAALVKGFVSLRRKDYVDAMERAEAVLARRPADEPAMVLKAQILHQSGRSGEAVRLLEEKMAAGPPSRAMLDSLIEIHEKTGNAAGVKSGFERLVALEAADSDSRVAYARFILRQGQAREGLAYVRPLLSSSEAVQFAKTVGAGDGAGLKGADIEALAGEAVPEARVTLAAVALDLGFAEEAARIIAPFGNGEVSSATATPLAIHAAAQYQLGRKPAAAKLAGAILEFDPTNRRALGVRASLAIERGDLAAALRDAQLLVRDYPRDLRNRLLLARVYEARGDATLAGLTYRQAYGDFPASKVARVTYANFLRQSGEVEAADKIASSRARSVSLRAGQAS